MNETPFVVETSGLTKRFGDREVVKDVELHVPRGSAFGYLGPNGAGKTRDRVQAVIVAYDSGLVRSSA